MTGCKFPEHHQSGGNGAPWALIIAAVVTVVLLSTSTAARIASDVVATVLWVAGGLVMASVAVGCAVVVRRQSRRREMLGSPRVRPMPRLVNRWAYRVDVQPRERDLARELEAAQVREALEAARIREAVQQHVREVIDPQIRQPVEAPWQRKQITARKTIPGQIVSRREIRR